METTEQKADFLRTEVTRRIATIDPATAPLWGKMNVQQMAEHLGGAIQMASGALPVKAILTPAENIARMQAFVQSDKPFKENTPNALLPDEPLPTKYSSLQVAIAALQGDIDQFFAHYKSNPGTTVTNPFFGELNYELQVQLLYKHAMHHLKQFGAA